MRTIASIAGERTGQEGHARSPGLAESRSRASPGVRARVDDGQWDDMVLVGRIARAHGNRGQVIVDPATDFPEERFKAGSVLHIRRGERHRACDGRERPVPSRAADYRPGGHRHDGRGRSAGRHRAARERRCAAAAPAGFVLPPRSDRVRGGDAARRARSGG